MSLVLPVAVAAVAVGAVAAVAAGSPPPSASLRLVSATTAPACLPAGTIAGAARAEPGTGDGAAAVAVAAGDGPPPRAAAALVVAPARVGEARAVIGGIERDGFPFAPDSVVVELSKPAFRLGPFRHVATLRPDGRFEARLDLPKDGFWVVRLEIPVAADEVAVLTDVLDVAPRP